MLIIEDGTSPAGAASYASVAEARAYASARGLSLPSGDSDVEALLIKAADYLDSLEPRFKGSRYSASQPLAWPRQYVYLFNSTDELGQVIPSQLKAAQCQLAVDYTSLDLLPTSDGREIIREKLDVLETEYAPKGVSTVTPTPSKALAILAPLFTAGFSLTTRRI